nr:MAG: hypothetical protein EDM05_33555 [Leptolyngbya sp. IPPAS B-1204]
MVFEGFDIEGLRAVLFAGDQAFSQNYPSVSTELILLGLVAQEGTATGATVPCLNSLNFFQHRGITVAEVQAAIRDVLGPVAEPVIPSPSPTPRVIEVGPNYTVAEFKFNEGLPFSERSVRAFERAKAIADRSEQSLISALHLLLGLIEEGQELVNGQTSEAVRVLEHLGVNFNELQALILQALSSVPKADTNNEA